jgi:succinoglycan biosynthesis protein ExoA
MSETSSRVCLIMPFLNEGKHLARVLDCIGEQRFDAKRLFLIAIDNGSTDDGPDIVEAWLREARIRGTVAHVPVRSIPHALNRGIALATARDYVIRLDAHTLYGPGYVAAIVDAFERTEPDVWCVGGAPVPAPTPEFGKAVHAALFTNRMGLGPADFRSSGAERPVSTVYLGAWRPGVLQHLGGFDDRWRANEDCELTERILAAGGKIVQLPLDFQKLITRGPAAAARQWARYGFWRAQTFKRHPSAIRLRHVAPPLALATALTLLATPARIALVPLGLAYAVSIVAFRHRSEPGTVTAATLAFFPVVHALYAAGLIVGALTPFAFGGRDASKRHGQRSVGTSGRAVDPNKAR